MKTKKSKLDIAIDAFIFIIMILVIILTLYPFINSLAISLNEANDTTRGGITFFPRRFTIENYKKILTNPKIYNAYIITIGRTVLGTITSLFFTAMIAYGLAHEKLKGQKVYTMLCLIPMYFAGGLLPSYFLIKSLGLTDNFLVYIIPNLVGLWNMILMRSFFKSLPLEVEESARIDGANYITTFFRIIIPISTPIIATVALFIAVWHWNDWFTSYLYIQNSNLKPMQSILLSIIAEANYAAKMAATMGGGSVDTSNISKGLAVNVRSLTMATLFVTIVPILLIYPFMQKYFVKGMMVGSLKG